MASRGLALGIWLLCLMAALPGWASAEEEVVAAEKRVADAARYLASDELEGRGQGTKGLDLAADYIARQFVEAGLKTDLFDGGPMQTFTAADAEARNVVAVLPGEGPLADETVVLGAHYDHLGRGGPGSLTPGQTAIHNGADDNASGVAVLLEVARGLASRPKKLRRSVTFIAFSGEERGLLGSKYYVDHPLTPLEKTVAMLNLDMVGHLSEGQLVAAGSGSGDNFAELLERLSREDGLDAIQKSDGVGASDHTPFYARSVPVIHFFTGITKDFHRPSDDFETLNISGMQRIGRLVGHVAEALADADGRPQYVAMQPAARKRPAGNRPYFGCIPDFAAETAGFAINSVTKDGPAEHAGLHGGDVVVEFGDRKISNFEDFDGALRAHKAGDRVPVVVRRGEESLKCEVTLDSPR